MFATYFKNLYRRTMRESYALAQHSITQALSDGGECLDCGASSGQRFERLGLAARPGDVRYQGIEWDAGLVADAQRKGIDVIQGDLNQFLPFENERFECVFALSLLEHLLNPCRFLAESHRVLRQGGTLVLLTPNISTYFTALLILAGKMPSSGPHPDSNALVTSEELFRVRPDSRDLDAESDTPVHRHLIVFSFLVLRRYLRQLGFREVRGKGFGLYPFPNFAQPLLEKLDPYHCHQMVFVATK